MIKHLTGGVLLSLLIVFGLTSVRAENTNSQLSESVKLVQVISELPEGIWKSEQSKALKDRDLKSVTVYVYNPSLIMIEYIDLDGEKKLYPLKEPAEYATGSFDDDYLDNEDITFSVKSAKKVFLYDEGTTIILRKQRSPKIDKENMVGVWQFEYEGEKGSLSINESGEITLYNEDNSSKAGYISYVSKAGMVVNFEDYGEVTVWFIYTINENKIKLISDSDVDVVFKKISDRPIGQLLLDENGNAVTINKLSITTKLGELMAETILDLKFTNPNTDTSEVAFRLPLPSEGIVVSYSLEINGKMIPSSVIDKTTARQAFDEIQARGVDPGLAEISINNQFTTEIFPVRYQEQRRIIVSYVEPVKKRKHGLVTYSFPLQKIGEVNELDINVISAVSKPKISGLGKPANVNSSISNEQDDEVTHWKINAQAINYLADKPINVRLKVKEKKEQVFQTKVTQASSGELYFMTWGAVNDKQKVTNKPPVKKVVIAWDNSLSMRGYHQDYMDLMTLYIKRLKGVDVTVVTFSDKVSEIDLGQGDEREIIRNLNAIEYDSASNFKHLQDILKRDADYYVVLSDGLATFNSDSISLDFKPIFTISPPQADINGPLLKSIAEYGNYFELNEVSNKKVANNIGVLPDNVRVTTASDNLEDISVSRSYGFESRYLITGRLKNDDVGNFEITFGLNEAQDFIVDPSAKLSGEEGKYLWAQSMLKPLQAWPTRYKTEITAFGIKHKIATQFTSLIVLEEIRDYVRYGIEPPSEIEGFETYSALRVDDIEYEKKSKAESTKEVLLAWQNRLDWWKDPLESLRKKEELRKAREREFRERFPDGRYYGDEEVVVTGIRASVVRKEKIVIEPWSPDTPYMKAILANDKNSQYQEYLEQRKVYQRKASFYMDVAKHFFDQGRSDLGVKIILNILEVLPDSPTMQRTVAYVLMQYNEFELAINVLEKVDLSYPFQATSKRDLARAWEGLASKTKRRKHFSKALHYYYDAATKVSDKPSGLPIVALTEMNRLLPEAKASGVDVSWIDAKFLGKQTYDVRVLLSWSSSQTDVDLHVLDPNEFDVFYGKRYSPIGGYFPYDDTSGFGPEVFLLKNKVSGEFKIKAKYYSDNTAEAFGPTTLILDLYLNYGKENEQHKKTSVRIDKEKDEIDVGALMF